MAKHATVIGKALIGLVVLSMVAVASWLALQPAQPPRQVVAQALKTGAGAALAQEKTVAQAKVAPPTAPAPASSQQTLAEKISRLQRGLENDRANITTLKKRIEDPKSDYHTSELEFRTLDVERNAKLKKLQQLKDQGDSAEAVKAQRELDSLDAPWELARNYLDLAILERRTLQEKVAALETKLTQDQQALDRLLGRPTVNAASWLGISAEPDPAAPRPQTPPPTKVENGAASPAPPPSPANLSPQVTTAPPLEGKSEPNKKAISKELVKAREDAKLKEGEAKAAKASADALAERLRTLTRSIELEKQLLQSATQRAEQARTMRANLDKELQGKAVNDPGLPALRQQLAKAQQRLTEAEADMHSITERLAELETDSGSVRADLTNAGFDAERKRQEAAKAEEHILQLENPFTLANIVQWLKQYGPRVAVILGVLLVLRHMVRLSCKRIVKLMVASSTRGTEDERANRAHTLVGVFHNAATLAIGIGGTVMLLDAINIPIVPLMGGAAVIGLAVAFGAQNLIKDYFSGFMVLLENQYGVNDVIKIGNIAGKVESITLRMTVLRDNKGVVHFIPHGTIQTVSNMTHGYSVAFLNVSVPYQADVNEVMRLLIQLGKELRHDATFGPRILEDLEMLGVDELTDSAVMLKCFIKTKPMQQWPVKRELLRRIKQMFDEQGSELSAPRRSISHPSAA